MSAQDIVRRRVRSLSLAFAVALVLVSHAAYAGGVVYVDKDAAGADDGSSWVNAYTALRVALADAAYSGFTGEVWVAEGTYKPTDDADRTKSFQLLENVHLYGGFDGTEAARGDRDWTAHETILSGDIGVGADDSDNSYRVVLGADNATLDGFTISGGNADLLDSINENKGGGMHNDGVSPTVRNCIFRGNAALFSGGGMLNTGSSVTVEDCTFEANTAKWGGGMYCLGGGTPSIINSRFIQNSSEFKGGGMTNSASVIVQGCLFDNNESDYGGGIYNGNNAPTITGCIFRGNAATGTGGGAIANSVDTTPTITNCTFYGNSAYLDRGGALYNRENADPIVKNCILWDNSTDPANEVLDFDAESTSTVTYSCVEGGHAGTGNIGADPLFVNAAGGDLHLQSTGGHWTAGGWVADAATSPCADAGDPTSAYANEPAPNGYRVNMGAYGNTAEASKTYLPSAGTHHDFENAGSPYVLTQHDSAPPASIVDGVLLLTQGGTKDQLNSICFDRVDVGTHDSLRIQFDFKFTNPTLTGADGLGFLLLPTSTCGTSGPAPGFQAGYKGENPNYPGAFGLGFDTYNGGGPGNFVSRHWDDNWMATTSLDPLGMDIESGEWFSANVLVEETAGGSNVTIKLTSEGTTKTVCSEAWTGGFAPYEYRVAFIARTGTDTCTTHLDNVWVRTALDASGGDESVDLSWTNPINPDHAGMLILRREGAAPTGTPTDGVAYVAGNAIGDGTVAYVGTGSDGTPGAASTWTEPGLTNGTTYYYKGFALDATPDYSYAGSGSATPAVPAPAIGLSATSLDFSVIMGDPNPAGQDVDITNTGDGGTTLTWTIASDKPWATVAPDNGTTTVETDTVTVSVDQAGLESGTHTATLTVTAPGASNTPRTITVTFGVIGEASLVAHWKLDEGAGSVAADSSGYGNDGVLVDNPVWIDAAHGKGLRFDGTDDYVNCGDILNDVTVPFTVAAWVYRETGHAKAIVRSDDGSGHYGFWMQAGSNNLLEISYGDGTGSGGEDRRTKKSGLEIPGGHWVHVAAVVRSATDMSIYFDGADVGGTYSGSGGAMVHSSSPLAIGKGGAEFFTGRTDDVRIYNRDLTAVEVEDLATAGPPALRLVRAVDATHVDVTYTEPVAAASAEVAGNYAIDGGINVTGAVLDGGLKTVTLTTTAMTAGTEYTLTVNNVEDLDANAIAPNSEKDFIYEPGLVAYWKLDEGAGNTAKDSSGYGQDGVLLNGPTWIDAAVGKGLDFDGTDDYVVCGDILNTVTVPFTMTAWVYRDVAIGTTIINTDPAATYYGFRLQIGSDNKLAVHYCDGTGSGSESRRTKRSDIELPTGRWIHVAAVVRGAADMSLYFDGVDVGGVYTGSGGAIVHSADQAVVGCGWGGYHDGALDDVRIYDRDLAAGEVAALADPVPDTRAPSNVTGLTCTDGDEEVPLSWTNPINVDFAGVLVLRREGAAPTGTPTDGVAYVATDPIGDGTVVYVGTGTDGTPGAASTWTDTGRTNGTTYHYKVFAFDEVPNYASGVTGSATPFEHLPAIGLSATALDFSVIMGDPNPAGQDVDITNTGDGGTTLTWTIASDKAWATVAPDNGTTTIETDTVTVSVDQAGLASGTHTATLTVTAAGASNTPRTITVTFGVIGDPDLVAHWKMDDAGGTATDSSGYGNQGTLTDGPVWDTGQIAGGLKFDGIDDRVEIGDKLNGVTVPFTLTAWIHTTGTGEYAILQSDDNTDYYGFWWLTNANNTMHIAYGDGTGNAGGDRRSKNSAVAIPPDTWAHVAAVVRGPTDMTLYINGGDAGGSCSGTGGAMVHSADPAIIGKWTVWGDYRMKGLLDDLRVYNRGLSNTEIENLAGVRPPIISTYDPATPHIMVAGTSQVFEIWAHDDEGDPLTHSWKIDGTPTAEIDTDLTYNPALIDVGPHTITASVSDGHGTASHTWDVTVVTTTPTIGLSTNTLSPSCAEGQDAAAQSFEVWNASGGTLNYTITVAEAWLAVNPANGTADFGDPHDTIDVTYTTAGLAQGNHTAKITVTDGGATNSPQEITVSLTVGPPPTLACDTSGLTALCVEGQNASPQTFRVRNSGGGTLSYAITDNAGWLSCTPSAGTSTGEQDTITVNFSTSGLSSAVYWATIRITADGAGSPYEMAVVLTVSTPSSGSSGGGGGGGCSLAADSGDPRDALIWAIPYLLLGAVCLLLRWRERSTARGNSLG